MVVPSVDDRNRESWRILVKKRIANIAKLKTLIFLRFDDFFAFEKSFWIFANQPYVLGGGVSRVRVRGS